jgi:hypothetical protein
LRKLFLAPLIVFLCFSFLSFWKPAKATSGEVSLFPVEDTITSLYNPNSQAWSNYTTLQLGNDNTMPEIKEGWFKFEFSEIPAGARITGASFHIYCENIDYYSGSYYNYYTLYSLTDFSNETWDSDTITYNNAPTTLFPVYDCSMFVSSAPEYKGQYILSAGNDTYGLQSIEYAFNNSLTKSYCVKGSNNVFMASFRSEDNSLNRPYLSVSYNITSMDETSEETSPSPSLDNPKIYDLLFYVRNDTVIKSQYGSLNFGWLNKSSIAYDFSINEYVLLKFNLSYPDKID